VRRKLTKEIVVTNYLKTCLASGQCIPLTYGWDGASDCDSDCENCDDEMFCTVDINGTRRQTVINYKMFIYLDTFNFLPSADKYLSTLISLIDAG